MKLFFLLICIPSLLIGTHDFVYLTNPKSGTHLVVEVLKEISGLNWLHLFDQTSSMEDDLEKARKNNLFLFRHGFKDNEINFLVSNKYKVIFLYRDPRDQLISRLFWVTKVDPNDPLNKIKDINEKIKCLILGTNGISPSFETRFIISYEQMKKIPSNYVYKVRFEDIIGSKGGGNDEVQLYTILGIANFLEVDISIEKAQEIANKLWGKQGTFRKGIIGDWRNYFNSEHIELYKEKHGDDLIKIGYEKDFNW